MEPFSERDQREWRERLQRERYPKPPKDPEPGQFEPGDVPASTEPKP